MLKEIGLRIDESFGQETNQTKVERQQKRKSIVAYEFEHWFNADVIYIRLVS